MKSILFIILLSILVVVSMYFNNHKSELENETKIINLNTAIPEVTNIEPKVQKQIPLDNISIDIVSNKNKTDNFHVDDNRKVLAINELESLESKFLISGIAVNVAEITNILNDDVFYKHIETLRQGILSDPKVVDKTDIYLDTFIEALNEFEFNEIKLENFQCGKISCIASFNANSPSSWDEFLSIRKEASNEEFPASSVLSILKENIDSSFTYRLFFSTNNTTNLGGFISVNPGEKIPEDFVLPELNGG